MDRRNFLQASTIATAALASSTARADDAKDDLLGVAREVILAWRRKDLEGMLSHIDDDIVWHSHVGSPPILGKAAMREFAGKLTAQMQDIRWRIFEAARDGNRLHVEWRDYFDRALFDRLKAGEPLPEYLEALTNRTALF